MKDDELHNADSEDLEYWLLEVEKSFHLTFGQDELAGVQTFGDLTDRITDKFTLVNSNDCTTQQAFYKLRMAITGLLEVDSVTPSTLLADILPRKARIQNTKRLERELGFKLHLLEPPGFVVLSLFAFLVASLFGFFINYQIGIIGVLIPVVGFWLATKLGKELTVKTAGELARRVAREHYILSRRDATTFNRNEIEELLADWLCNDFSLTKSKLTRESKFVWALSTQR